MNNQFSNLPKNCFVIGPTGPMGPTGPQGEPGNTGVATTILGSYDSLEEFQKDHPTGYEGNAYMVEGDLYIWFPENQEWVDVGIIRGPKGDPGEMGPIGPTGAAGKDGTGVTILGNYSTEEELNRNHPQGSPGDSYLVGDNLFVWSEEENKWINVGMIRGPKGETGPQGIQGPPGPQGPQGIAGPLNIPIGFFLTTVKDLTGGSVTVLSNENLPLASKEMDTSSNYYLNSENNTIVFYKAGIYRIDFSAMIRTTNSNVISIGIKKVGENIVYAGTSVWGNSTTPTLVTGYGILNLPQEKQWLQLTNLGKDSIIIQSPSMDNLITEADVVSPAVTISIQKLQ